MEQLAHFVLTIMHVLRIQNHSESAGSYLNSVYILSAFYHGPISLYKKTHLPPGELEKVVTILQVQTNSGVKILINHSFVHVRTHNLHTDLCICPVVI